MESPRCAAQTFNIAETARHEKDFRRASLRPLRVKDAVTLTGLKDDASNGQRGEVVRYDSSTGRYGVKVGAKTLGVKPCNLLALHNKMHSRARFCRFGSKCWRPHCYFVHDDEDSRIEHWATVWEKRRSACDVKTCDAQSADKVDLSFSTCGDESHLCEQCDPDLASSEDGETLDGLKMAVSAHAQSISASSDHLSDLKARLDALDQKLGAELNIQMLKVLEKALEPMAETVCERMIKLEWKVNQLDALTNTPDIPERTNDCEFTANLLQHTCAKFVFACIVFCALTLLLSIVFAQRVDALLCMRVLIHHDMAL